MATFSAITAWFTTKFFLGRKLDRLRDQQKSENEIDNLLWIKKVFKSSNLADMERMDFVIFTERYDFLFPLEVVMLGSEIDKRIDDFIFLIRMHGYKEAEKIMRENLQKTGTKVDKPLGFR